MSTVFLNGRFVAGHEAMVSAFDAGLQHGVGLFETMIGRLAEGRASVHRLGDHLDRLAGSAAALGLSESVRTHALAEAVCRTVEEAGRSPEGLETERWRVRLTITGGDLNLLERRAPGAGGPGLAGEAITPTVLISAHPAVRYPDEMFERGVAAVIADVRSNPLDPFAGHKTLNYWGRLRELQRAAAARAGEAIVLQVSNHLAGGCVSNVFLVRGGALQTPIARGEEGGGAGGKGGAFLPSPVLPGVTRREILEAAAEEGIGVEKRMLSIDDLLGADEVFLTNSSWGVLPVVRVEQHGIGSGEPGRWTRALRAGLTGDSSQ